MRGSWKFSPPFWSALSSLPRRQTHAERLDADLVWMGWGTLSIQRLVTLWDQVRPARGCRGAGGKLERCGHLAGKDKNPAITPRK